MPYMLAPGARLYVGPHGQMEESLGACCAPCASGGSCTAMGATPARRRSRRGRPRHQPLHGILDMLGLTSSTPTDTSSSTASSAFLAQPTDVTAFNSAAPAAPADSGGDNWLTSLLSAVTSGVKNVAGSVTQTTVPAAGQVVSAPRAPAPGGMSTNQMIMIGGVAVLGVGALVLLSRKR